MNQSLNESVRVLNNSANSIQPGPSQLEWASFSLLLFTAVMAISSHVFQKRTGIRESIEQLDEIIFIDTIKMKPMLHKFNYGGGPIGNKLDIYRPTVEIEIKFYDFEISQLKGDATDSEGIIGLSEPVSAKETLEEEIGNLEELEEDLEDEFNITVLDIDKHGLRFRVQSYNPIRCRNRADDVMKYIVDR